MKRILTAIAVAALATAGGTTGHNAAAAVIYQYTGEPFMTASAPYTTADFVSGYVEFASMPPALGTFDETDLVDYSFTAGPLTLTPGTPGSSVFANFTFDAGGLIETWLITVTGFTADTAGGLDESINTDWNGVDGDDYTDIDNATAGQAFNEQTPGVWTAVPEPSSLALVGLAGGSLLWARRRPRKRSPNATA